jgi:two-component system, NarL family, sensor histidine kinase UhpB
MSLKETKTRGKSLSLLTILFFLTLCSNAQVAYTKEDSAKIYAILSRVDDQMLSGSMDSALAGADYALQLSKQKKMLRGEGFAILKKADILVQQSDETKPDPLYADAFKIAGQLKDSFMLALAFYQQGQYIMYDGRYDEAERLYEKALATHFEKAQSSYTGLVYNDLGYLYGGKGQMEKQVFWYLKAARVLEQSGDLAGYATTTSSLAAVYYALGNLKDALKQIHEAIAIREKIGDIQGLAYSYGNLARFYTSSSLDSAAKYQKIALRYAERSGVKRTMVQSYDNASVILDRLKKHAEALEYAKKATALCEEMNDQPGVANHYMWSAVLSSALQDHDAVEEYYRKAYDISIKNKNKGNLRDIFASKANYYKNRSDFKSAYENLKLFYTYRDSIINKETETNIADLQLKYQTEKKDNEITRLNADQKIKHLELEKQQAIIAGNMQEAQRKQNEIDLLTKSRELQELKIKQQGEQLEKQLLISQTNQQQLVLAQQEKLLNAKQLQNQKQFRNALIIGSLLVLLLGIVLFNRYQLKRKLEQQQAMQRIRNDIARDLHDEIGSTLTSINILSTFSEKNLERDRAKTVASLQQITEQSHGIQQAMSDIVWAIKPDNDKLQNMVVHMREFVSHTLEPKDISIDFEVDKTILPQTLPMEQRRDFFLVFKEAVNNAAKYSRAGKVIIRLARKQQGLQLLVKDDGIGFNTGQLTSSNGIKNMKERAEALKGNLTIDSSVGTGTSIMLQFPATY